MDTMLHPPFHTEISMAKTQTTIPETDTTQPDATVAAPSAATVEKDTASEKNPKKEQAPKAATEIPAAVLAILGNFPTTRNSTSMPTAACTRRRPLRPSGARPSSTRIPITNHNMQAIWL